MLSHNKRSIVTVIFAQLVVLLFTFNSALACDSCSNHAKSPGQNQHSASMHSQHAQHQHGEVQGKVDASGKAKGATMGFVFDSAKLYTCVMHPEIVTDNPDAKCPLCNMNLSEMSQEKMDSLKKSHPKGCVMDPIVLPGNSKTDKCSICNMNLSTIKESKSQHSDHGHH